MSIKVDDSEILIKYDFLGNIFLNFKDEYYYFDIIDQLELVKINNIDFYKKYLLDNKHIEEISEGKINPCKGTLKGATMDFIKDNDEIHEKNIDEKFIESKYYHMEYDKIEEDHFVDISEEGSYVNCQYLDKCDFVFINPPSNDFIYMEDNIVKATVENKTGFCTKRITLYSDNKIRVYFIGDRDYFYKINVNNDKLSLEKNDF